MILFTVLSLILAFAPAVLLILNKRVLIPGLVVGVLASFAALIVKSIALAIIVPPQISELVPSFILEFPSAVIDGIIVYYAFTFLPRSGQNKSLSLAIGYSIGRSFYTHFISAVSSLFVHDFSLLDLLKSAHGGLNLVAVLVLVDCAEQKHRNPKFSYWYYCLLFCASLAGEAIGCVLISLLVNLLVVASIVFINKGNVIKS
ncbi:hypothetical protein RCL1_000072 [Eukaryota sp. TZLM3-RCL]